VEGDVFGPGTYGLYEMTRPAGSEPAPPEYEESRRLFETARQKYEKGQYVEAARGFIDAARVLPRDSESHASTLAADRAACYRNAVSAYILANAGDEARRELIPLIKKDPACADVIRGELTRLPE